MKIAITAESTIDLPQELLKKFDIKTVPFTVLLGDKVYNDGEISPSEIFKFVDENKTLPKTSAVNGEQYKEFFSSVLKDYDAIVHFSLSSEISSACKNAVETAKEFENVFVVDTLSLSTGIALLAIKAREMANDGKTAKEIYENSCAKIKEVQASFVIKKLTYLHKGGRCSTLSYLGANLLMIRPQIIVSEGKMSMHKKYLGNMKKVISKYCLDTFEEFSNPDLSIGFVTHAGASDEMIEVAKKAMHERGFKQVYVTSAGATISSHCGENTLGILYLNKN